MAAASIPRYPLSDLAVTAAPLFLAAAGYLLTRRRTAAVPIDRCGQENWRMPPLALLGKAEFSTSRKIGMAALRLYLAVAMILVIIKIVQVALGH